MPGGADQRRLRPRPASYAAARPSPPPHLPPTSYSPHPYLQNPIFFPPNPFHPNLFAPPPSAPPAPSEPPEKSRRASSSFPRTRAPQAGSGELRERAAAAVAKAHRELVEGGEGVSSWKVVQSALLSLKVDSWGALGFQMQDVPTLHRLMITEGKINAFIHCFVGVRRITSVYDLNDAICKSEGVEAFEEFGLGPLLRHSLVGHYFSVPFDGEEIFKVTSEEIISALDQFMYVTKGKKIMADAFLDYLAKELSAPSREALGVRIQSLGFHIASIRAARRAEWMGLDNYARSAKDSSNERAPKRAKHSSKSSVILSQKEVLDKRFSEISARVEKFSSIDDRFEGKHIRFDSCGSEEENGVDENCEVSEVDEHRAEIQNMFRKIKIVDHRVNRCPYPSQAEEILRLGIKARTGSATAPANNIHAGSRTTLSRKLKRRSKCQASNASRKSAHLLPNLNGATTGDAIGGSENLSVPNYKKHYSLIVEQDGRISATEDDLRFLNDVFSISKSNLEMFLNRWGPACKQQSIFEVLDEMVYFYGFAGKRKKKVLDIFSVDPALGLINIAMMHMKSKVWDNCSDSLKGGGGGDDPGLNIIDSVPHSEAVDVEELSRKDRFISATEPSCKIKYRLSANDIAEKVVKFFELDDNASKEGKSPLGRHLMFLKKFRECELWLVKQFSVKDFNCLGHGEFFEFLEKHISLIPYRLFRGLIDDHHEKTLLGVTMSQKQLLVFLSQASYQVGKNYDSFVQHITSLLQRQFPMLSFEIMVRSSEENMSNIFEKKTDICSSVTFSSVLLSNACEENLEDQRVGCLGPMSSIDALDCLVKAPMLSDLLAWSHWDSIYGPSLGPILEWLFTAVHTGDLACIVTREGRLIRVDPSVTITSVLEALLKQSSYQSAVNLLSLVYLYNGVDKVPVSLLKRYAAQAIEVIIKNYMDGTEVNIDGRTFRQQKILEMDRKGTNECPEKIVLLNGALAVASRFILGCLSHIPSEFRCYAANILLFGLLSFTKDAPSVILRECEQNDEFHMLHDIGLCLGIREWIDNYHLFGDKSVVNLPLTAESNKTSDGRSNSFQLMPSPVQHVISDSKFHEDCTDLVNESGSYGGKKVNKLDDLRSEKPSDDYLHENIQDVEAFRVIEMIRKEEFGLDSNIDPSESTLLKKQHARLGRALHCLSQELYSQDSHFILELVQNADDNIYAENVEPTVIFILQETGIIVLNNERGFSSKNIRALCDVGNSTKKGSGTGYIGQKGIGFKSVFRVTNAPEIHSNGFHVKFDISEGQIGFVLPTVIPPCDVDSFTGHLSAVVDQVNDRSWNTCIVLPFQSKLKEGPGLSSVMSLFIDLHPSLLLFLNRLQCIMYKNVLNGSLIIMRKEMIGNGIIKVSDGNRTMNWLVSRKKLQANITRPGVFTTEIAVAFTLQEVDNSVYEPLLEQQPVFAFLPLRTYGLKFILQGDFVLPSSREEVDGDSAWNQWLLSEFPTLFVDSEKSFCNLPCFRNNPGKAVTAYMSFVPLIGEVHGFFSNLPHMVISKLRVSTCLLLEGSSIEWVPPCRVLRGWNDQARSFLSESFLSHHLGLGYLNKEIFLSDSLAKALGVQDYGPKTLIEVISSVCNRDNGVKSIGLDWLSSWLVALYNALSVSLSNPQTGELEHDILSRLKKISFIPLSDGSFGCVMDGPIWLPYDSNGNRPEGEHNPEDFLFLHAKLRTVNPLLFLSSKCGHPMEETDAAIMAKMLAKIGVQQLSAHEIVVSHILPAMSSISVTADKDKNMIADYLSFVMFHMQSSCPRCQVEKTSMISELKRNAIVVTNNGFKRPFEDPVHFSKAFENSIDVGRLIGGNFIQWHEVDAVYLNHPCTRLLSSGLKKWREFLEELAVSDFVRVLRTEKKHMNLSSMDSVDAKCMGVGFMVNEMVVEDWESPEMVHLLSNLSSNKCLNSCMYLLEVLDKMWEGNFAAKATIGCNMKFTNETRRSESSFVKCLRNYRWMVSSMDGELYYPKDLYYKCDAVYSILGDMASYAVPQVQSQAFVTALGLKTQVSLDDALILFQQWKASGGPIMASVAQMSRFYTFVSNEVRCMDAELEKFKSGPLVFLPYSKPSTQEDVVCGQLLAFHEVFWLDPTGCIERTEELVIQKGSSDGFLNKTLGHLYPSLYDFFVKKCSIHKTPPSGSYLQILLDLVGVALPSEAADAVLHVLLRWADDLKHGVLKPEEISFLKECLQSVEYALLPTQLDRWVSLHSSFGLLCWSDDEDLGNQFKHSLKVDFLYFGQLNDEKKQMISSKISVLLQALGIPSLSEIVTREAISYGLEDSSEKFSLVNWILPYAQRYLYVLHPNEYSHFKKVEYERLSKFQVVVVEKLYYRHTIKTCESTSNKRFECGSLLQGDTLYVVRTSDVHSLFLELSRFFFNGSVNLHLANFLHMVTTMAESGSTERQTEFFIVNSQKVQKLPENESVWSLSSSLSPVPDALPMASEHIPQPKLKSSTASNWPPSNWKSAPDFRFAKANNYRTQPFTVPSGDFLEDCSTNGSELHISTEDWQAPTEMFEWVTVDQPELVDPLPLQNLTATTDESLLLDSRNSVDRSLLSDRQTLNISYGTGSGSGDSMPSTTVTARDQLQVGALTESEAKKIGRLGELAAYKYFVEKMGSAAVKWVNKETETGLPFDLVIGDGEQSKEYIEVKATKSMTKDWFEITTREWQFAVDKGDSFSLARVVFEDSRKAKVTILKNPYKLCRQNMLRLVILLQKQPTK